VTPLPFNLGLVQFLADHRISFLTDLALASSFLGDVGGYIFIATLIYVAWNKRLAIQLAFVAIVALSINDLLKIFLKNPRPFIRDGSYLKRWAVPAKKANELAAQYSTPSGHATGAASFYSCLYHFLDNRLVRVLAVAAILLIGLSRPYLGVHYFEDVLLGWALGLAVALVSIKYTEAISGAWNRLAHARQMAIVVAAGLAFWLFAVRLNGQSCEGQPHAYLCYGGFLTGMILARPLELRIVNFDPRSSNAAVKFLRFLLTLAMAAGTLLLLGWAFAWLADPSSLLWRLLEYLRFAATGFVIIFLAPLLFTRIGWAKAAPDKAS
jgi:membrane-associated phospholipid phosphatase